MADQVFTLVAVPFRSSGEQQRASQFTQLQQALGPLGPVARLFMIPNLKVGTLDSLLEASDELTKLDPQLEGACFKLAGILEEVSGSTRQSVTMLRINPQSNDVACDYFLKDFSWNSAVYDPKESISALLHKFAHVASGAEERTRGALSEFAELKNRLVSASRRSAGNLSLRPIGDVVRSWCHQQGMSAPVDSEFMTTVFVAVAKSQQDEFMATYAGMNEFVVPKSASVVSSDSEFFLNAIVVFKKVAEDVKIACRKQKFMVREHGAVGEELSAEETVELERKVAADKSKLTLLLAQQFTQVYVAWAHAKAVRVFVEAMLRFGLPPKFVPVIIAADGKKEEEVRGKLAALYSDYSNKFQKGDDAMIDVGSLMHDYPYVCLKVSNVLKAR